MKLKHRLCFLGICAALLFGCNGESNQPHPSEQVSSPAQSEIEKSPLKVLDLSEREYGDLNAIAIRFNMPINPDQDFSRCIHTEPQLPAPVLSEDGKLLYFTGIAPEQEYSVSIDTGVVANSGKKLLTAIKKTLKTRALASAVSFEQQGLVMVPDQVEALPILSVNVPEADIDVYKVRAGKVVNFFDELANLNRNSRWLYYENRLTQTLDHVYSARLETGSQKNKRNRSLFSIKNVPDIEDGGLYFATLRTPGGFDFHSAWFSVSALGIQFRDYEQSSHFIVQDLTHGDVVEGVELEILNYENKIIAAGTTDKQGVWQSAKDWRNSGPRLILARKDQQVTVLEYYAESFDLSGFNVSGRSSKPIEHLLYSPRDIYRPGEELIISSIVRDHDGQLLPGPIKLELFKPDGNKQGEWRLEQTRPGYYEFNYTLANNAPLGQWQARVYSPGQKKLTSLFNFKVEEFLPERMRLTIADGVEKSLSFNPGDKIEVPVKGEYLFGAPAAGNRLDTQVTLSAWSEPFKQHKGFIFGDGKSVAWRQFSLDTVMLNNQGATLSAVPLAQLDWNQVQSPARLSLGYSLFETGGRTVNRNQSVLLWPKTSFIGVQPQFEGDLAEADSVASFSLLRVNQNGEAQAKGQIKATLVRMEQKYFWSHTPERGWHYQIEKNEYPVASDVIDITSAESIALSFPVEWGEYRLELLDQESEGKTVYRFQAGENWYVRWRDASDRIQPEKVTLALDKGAYKAGDLVNVKLVAPASGRAVILLETDKVLLTKLVSLKEREAEVSLKIPDNLSRHDAYISAFVVTPTDGDKTLSKRSFGMIHLPLDRRERQLKVEIDVADRLHPDTQAQVNIAVTSADDQTVDGEYFVSLSAVDSGVLSVTGYEQPDPFDFFYGRRAYQGRITDMYDDVAVPRDYTEAEVHWGGDADLERGGEAPPTDVQITSLFTSMVEVQQGRAQIELNLPEFEGELTLSALAMGQDEFGRAKAITKVASPLVVQLSKPRFMALGDEAVMVLDMTNLSGHDAQVRLQLEISGAGEAFSSEYQFDMGDQAKQVLQLPITAAELGRAKILANFDVISDTQAPVQIRREWFLAIRSAYPAVFDQVSTVLQSGEEFKFPYADTQTLQLDTVESHLRIARTPDLQMQRNFDKLLAYPYACLEQTTSKVKPLGLLLDGKATAEQVASVPDIKLHKTIKSALNRYAQLQKSNGSFALWEMFSAEQHWLTVYTVEFLLKLQQQGFNPPVEMVNMSRDRLRHYVRNANALTVQTVSDIPSHYQISYKAYAAYVLAKHGQIGIGSLRDLAERELMNARGKLPGVHLGLALLLSGSVDEGQALIQQALAHDRAEGYLGDYGSRLRDLAQVVQLILATPGVDDAIVNQALQLLPEMQVELQRKPWLSTQERVALMKLAAELRALDTGKPWSGVLYQATLEKHLESDSTLSMRLDRSALNETVFKNNSDDPLITSFSWTGITAAEPEPSDQGIRLSVESFKVVNGQANILRQGELLNVGDWVLTRVHLYSETRVPDALLVHLIPAGFELENQNLKHALKLADIKIEGITPENQARIEHQEYRDDRYVAAISLPARREQTVYYLSRAVTPGRFKVPPAIAESMYTPQHRGVSNSLGQINVTQ